MIWDRADSKPGVREAFQWSTPDPAKVLGTEADAQAAFDRVFNLLKERVAQVVAAGEHSGEARDR